MSAGLQARAGRASERPPCRCATDRGNLLVRVEDGVQLHHGTRRGCGGRVNAKADELKEAAAARVRGWRAPTRFKAHCAAGPLASLAPAASQHRPRSYLLGLDVVRERRKDVGGVHLDLGGDTAERRQRENAAPGTTRPGSGARPSRTIFFCLPEKASQTKKSIEMSPDLFRPYCSQTWRICGDAARWALDLAGVGPVALLFVPPPPFFFSRPAQHEPRCWQCQRRGRRRGR